MLRLLTGLVCLMIGQPLLAQIRIDTYGTTSSVNVSDPNGQLYSGVTGSPYYPSDSFYPGKMSNGPITADRTIRFNMISGLPEYVEGKKVVTPSASINNVLINTPEGGTLLFKNGFPPIDRQSLTAFYQVLVDGQQVSLVVWRYAVIKEGQEPMDSNFGKKWFEPGERYYLYRPDTRVMQPLNSPKAIIGAIPEKTALLKQYAAEQKLRLKEWDDAIRLVSYADKL